MKTADQIQKTIYELRASAEALKDSQDPKEIREKNRLLTRIDFHKFCKHYLLSSPSEDFIQKEIERLTNRINMFHKEWKEPENLPKKDAKKLLLEYEKGMGIPQIRKQITTLNFLIN